MTSRGAVVEILPAVPTSSAGSGSVTDWLEKSPKKPLRPSEAVGCSSARETSETRFPSRPFGPSSLFPLPFPSFACLFPRGESRGMKIGSPPPPLGPRGALDRSESGPFKGSTR